MQPASNGSTAATTAKRQQQQQGHQGRQPWVKRKRGVDLAPQDRLQHTATKEIGRELKRVKAFLLQRLVKRCRRLRGHGGGKEGKEGKDKGESSSGDGEKDDMAATAEDAPTVKACLEEIKAIKALSAESVAPVCLRRLGLAYTGSEYADLNEAASAPGPLKQVLEHPRMAALLQSFDERVTDLRRGGDGKMKSGRKRARGEGEGTDDENEGRGGGGAFKLERVHRKATAAHDGSSVFLDSLSGFVPLGGGRGRHRRGPEDDDAAEEEEGMDTYGYREFGAAAQRKNRPGQRARRAKMEAVQATMEGKRRVGQSSNWRKGSGGGGGGAAGEGSSGGDRGFGGRHGHGPDKAQRGGGRLSSSWQPSFGRSTHESPRSRPPPPGAAAAVLPKQHQQQQEVTSERLHPSWAAKQALRAKAGIGGFQGKKIKFSSDE